MLWKSPNWIICNVICNGNIYRATWWGITFPNLAGQHLQLATLPSRTRTGQRRALRSRRRRDLFSWLAKLSGQIKRRNCKRSGKGINVYWRHFRLPKRWGDRHADGETGSLESRTRSRTRRRMRRRMQANEFNKLSWTLIVNCRTFHPN